MPSRPRLQVLKRGKRRPPALISNEQSSTCLKPKLLMGGLSAIGLLALAAGVFWHKEKGLQTNLNHAMMLQQQGKDCVDLDPYCIDRFSVGECEWNAEYMNTACRVSCGTCPKASAFLPTVYTVTVPKNEKPSPENLTKCVTIEGVPVELVECPVHVTAGSGLTAAKTPGGFKLAVETSPATSTSTSVCVVSDPDITTGWPADVTFNCQAKAVLVSVGVGPGGVAPFTKCVTPPVLPANCPSLVTRNNRVPRCAEPDEFTVAIIDGNVCATGTTNWYSDLAFYCQAGEEVAPSKSVRVQFGEGEYWKESCTQCVRPKQKVDCPALATKINWATPDEAPEVFSITKRYDGGVCATRVDTIAECDCDLKAYQPAMWGTDFAVYCKAI